ncbi:phage holin family protein [Collinsella sp. AGMB00827]|uniref:Phage holin family protein n=1 Tax=Collinsella ureilytica TaxID=2869515 RepID=A0ABS7MM53_9ACTN|nr:phage holin family protein [Collinsella urealyticum]MBY4798156.1 phage holin family protein [Collinsella urealyticum]
MRFIINTLLTAIAVAVATYLVPGIELVGSNSTTAFIFVALCLGFVNSLVKPIISLLSLPITFITLGIFQLVINTGMFILASELSVGIFGSGIVIASSASAFIGAILVSIISSLLGVASKRM